MIAGEELLLIANDKSLDGNLKASLNKIIEEEIQKPESETDTELIEYCLNELSKLEGTFENDAEQFESVCNGGKRKRFKHKKLFTAAAAGFVGVVSLSAVAFGINLFQHR